MGSERGADMSERSKKKESKKGDPTIQIAKAEMTLTGFEHNPKVLRRKARLEARHQRQMEVVSNRKSSLKQQHADLDDFDDDDDESQQDQQLEELPMNQEIELSEHNLQD